MTEQATFWSAARDIVTECHAVLKPGGVAVFVTKDFVRNKKLAGFSEDWVRLCESCGFVLTKWARASLVAEQRHADLFCGETVTRTERKSFFRRLAEKKGSPRIDFEDALFFTKPSGDGKVDAVVSSPPFTQGYSSGGGINVKGYGADGKDKVGSRTYQALGGERIEGNLETMPLGTVDAVVGSPPYAEIASGAGGLNTKPPKQPGQQGGRSATSASQDTDQRYGSSEGQLARLPAGAVDAVVSSPPWGENAEGTFKGSKFKNSTDALRAGRGHGASDEARLAQLKRDEEKTYGDSVGNLAHMTMNSEPPVGGEPHRHFDEVVWHGCYDESWKGLIVDAAFAHPAKMARGLVRRIFDDLFLSGVLHRGGAVVDPFGGIGSTALEGASRGINVTICELEPKFVGLAKENIAFHRRGWDLVGLPTPRVIQGDSRKLRENIFQTGLPV